MIDAVAVFIGCQMIFDAHGRISGEFLPKHTRPSGNLKVFQMRIFSPFFVEIGKKEETLFLGMTSRNGRKKRSNFHGLLKCTFAFVPPLCGFTH